MFQRFDAPKLLVAALFVVPVAGCGERDAPADGPAAAVESPVDEATAGHVSGQVLFTGEPPTLTPIDMAEEPVCAEKHATPPVQRTVAVSESGALANVFVYVKEGLGDLRFPTPGQATLMDQDGCIYRPRVLGAQTGQNITFRNSDGLLHNINAQPSVNRGFNISQPTSMDSNRSFPNPEVMIPVRCDVHGWMAAYIGVLSHPYFAVTGDDGSFDLSTLPPGDYVVEAWHERYGVQTANVTVATGETAQVEFTFNEGMAANAVVPLGDPIDPHDHHPARSHQGAVGAGLDL